MPEKIKYMKCPSPGMGCMECGHRGKHKFVEACNHPCSPINRCVPYDPGMIMVATVTVKMVPYNLYQCPHCKTIKQAKTKPRCPECDKL